MIILLNNSIINNNNKNNYKNLYLRTGISRATVMFVRRYDIITTRGGIAIDGNGWPYNELQRRDGTQRVMYSLRTVTW